MTTSQKSAKLFFFVEVRRVGGPTGGGCRQTVRAHCSWPNTRIACPHWRLTFMRKYCIPQPQRVRRIEKSFAWIDHRLLRNGYLQVMSHQDQALYLFLVLAGDRHGVSFYRKEKILRCPGPGLGPVRGGPRSAHRPEADCLRGLQRGYAQRLLPGASRGWPGPQFR